MSAVWYGMVWYGSIGISARVVPFNYNLIRRKVIIYYYITFSWSIIETA